ncbi:MAG: sulfur carrier protein ThiS [Planctomycetes bacterium]|nr:sulfur carrier protein ThiS [Planctomycetota bacterium]
MQIQVNGKPVELPENATLAALLEHLRLNGKPCATEVNAQLVPKARQEQHRLLPNDKVEIVTLVGGG